MSEPWSGRIARFLEGLGRIRFKVSFRRPLVVGNPQSPDGQGGSGWKAFTDPEALFRVWGPVPGSSWEPFHCVPLFAALDQLARDKVGPTGPDDRPRRWENGRVRVGTGLGNRAAMVTPEQVRPGAPAPGWVDESTWTILDLPGQTAVEAGTWLVTAAGCQPVCTFDHWPHPRGVLRPERILAELLHWAGTVAEARQALTPGAPPVWICDSQRLGDRTGRPGEFDNRYFLDDSILPGTGLLMREGIRRVIYLSPGGEEARGADQLPLRDLETYFSELLMAGIEVLNVEAQDPALRPQPFSAPPSPRPPPRSGFRRSAAGGFGSEVPEPSSSSGG